MAVANPYETKSVNNYLQTQFKKLKKNEDDIKADEILASVSEKLKEKYTINKVTKREVTLKIDKKKNVDDMKADVISTLEESITGDIDINFLFKVFRGNNELIIRAKRLIQ